MRDGAVSLSPHVVCVQSLSSKFGTHKTVRRADQRGGLARVARTHRLALPGDLPLHNSLSLEGIVTCRLSPLSVDLPLRDYRETASYIVS